MTISRLLLPVMTCMLANAVAYAGDLDVSLHLHSDRVTFGDPLYVEVTIVNRRKEVVSFAPTYHSDRLRYEIRDPKTELVIWSLDAQGERAPLRFERGKPVRIYQYFFLPGLHRWNHAFWRPIQEGQTLSICAVYGASPGVDFRSQARRVVIETRADKELETLVNWSKADLPGSEKGPRASSFGLQLMSAPTRQQTQELASLLEPGEIKDLLQLTIRLKDLYAMPREARDEGNAALVEWLQTQSEIKRQALAAEVQSIALNNQMNSTADAIGKLLDMAAD